MPIQDWWAKNSGKYKTTTLNEKPIMLDDVHIPSLKPTISILEPNTQTTYLANQKMNVKISSFGPYPINKIDIFINDTFIETYSGATSFSFFPKELENLQTENELKIVARDSIYNVGETTITFKVAQ